MLQIFQGQCPFANCFHTAYRSPAMNACLSQGSQTKRLPWLKPKAVPVSSLKHSFFPQPERRKHRQQQGNHRGIQKAPIELGKRHRDIHTEKA